MSKKGHGHHGGSWKVAYADFVTAMMALFLCLWLTAQDTKIKDAVERAFRNPFSSVTKESTGIIPNKDASASYKQAGKFQSVSAVEMETMRHVSDDLTKLLQKQNDAQNSVQIDLTPDGLRINIFDRSHKPIFEPGSIQFTQYGDWVFSTLAWEISRYKTFRIELEGHTESSNQEESQTLDKWQLSTERANAARRVMQENGLGHRQVTQVRGYADERLRHPDRPEDPSNRRISLIVHYLVKPDLQDQEPQMAPMPPAVPGKHE